MINKVAIYVRVSTTNQAEEGYSIDEQKDKLKSYCVIKDWNIYEIYTDGGFSGSNTERPALEKLIKDAKSRKFDTVLVYKLDRLSRSQKDTLYLIEDVFLKHDISFFSLQENFDTSSPFGKAMIGLLSVFAQLEREQIKERMQLGKVGRAKSGKAMAWITPPFGYDYNSTDGTLTLNPVQAPIVKIIFDEYISGVPIKKIADRLNEKGHIGKNTTWKPNSLRHLLKNSTYAGFTTFKGEEYEATSKAIIDRKTFQLAQMEVIKRRKETEKRTNNSRPYQSKYMLSGRLKCGHCGGRITLYVSKARKDGTKLLKYYCVNRKKSCESELYSLDHLEDIVTREIKKLQLDDEYLKSNFQQSESLFDKEALLEEIKKINNKIQKLNNLYISDLIDLKELKLKTETLKKDKKSIETQLEQTDEEKENEKKQQIIDKLLSVDFDAIDYERKKELVNMLIKKITVTKNEVNISWNI